jgi:hypothetical protein
LGDYIAPVRNILLSKIGASAQPRRQGMISIRNGFILSLVPIMALCAAPAKAVEQCRFIQTKAEREACYKRQEAELAAKRKPAEPRHDAMMESLEQMKLEDQALDRQIHGICRGC